MSATELRKWAEDLEDFDEDFEDGLKRILSRGGVNIKRNAGAIYRAYVHHRYGGHTKFFPQGLTYDVKSLVGAIELEIGPDLTRSRTTPPSPPGSAGSARRQAPLGLFTEQGAYNETGRIGEAPMPALFPAGDAEERVMLAYVEELVERLLG
jgi:hypothetical protein